MGGTTAKCALVERGRFSVDSVYYANGYIKGFPIKSPVIDIVEVGSGGGSIIWLDEQKRVHVGPQSAGSTPGPVCYGRGGEAPTVTDANLLLGRLNPDHFLGGELALDTDLARARASPSVSRRRSAMPASAARSRWPTARSRSRPSPWPARSGASRSSMGSIRAISRCSAMAAVGHCMPRAWRMSSSIPQVIIPPEPGNFSAIGMLLADARIDFAKTFTGLLDDKIVGTMEEEFETMEREAADALTREFGASEIFYERYAEMRYRGQRHNIKVPITGLKTVEAIHEAFSRDYKRRYGHADLKAPAELQALLVSGFAKAPPAGYREPAAPRRQRPRREHTAGLFWQSRRPGRDACL